MKIDIEKAIKLAKEMGIEVQEAEPGEGGFYLTENGESKRLSTDDLMKLVLR